MPKRLSLLITRTSLGLTAVFLSFMPLAAFADVAPGTAGDAAPVCTAPAASTPGVVRPVGADSGTYTYNCGSNLWENAHYSFNPATGIYAAKDPVIYTYDPATGKYDTITWLYSAPHAQYEPVTISVNQPPAGFTVIGAPLPAAPANGNPTPGASSITNTGPGSDNSINNSGAGGTGSINQTGPNSTNTISGAGSNNLNLNNLNNVTVANLISGQATTGSASVLGNTTGGSATTGNAQDLATIVNMLQSASNALGGNTLTFVQNINGNVNGDLLLDPATLGAIQPAGSGTTSNNNLNVNNTTNATLTNGVNLNATTGDATVAQNTSAGDANSGSASAIANVVNLINSAITGGQSFLGVININGNLNGDILLPPNFIDQLIASNVPTVNVNIGNTGPSSNNTINSTGSNNTNVTNTNNQGITNNIQTTAASGNANVSQNTSAGNASTGSAATSITAFNLTGSNVIGSNDLLVFVNVMGKWVGMIVNAPGATAAELGSGITTNTSNAAGNNTTNVTNTTNQKITNNINLAAQSGNATVTQNTKAGNATTGNANTAVNLLNIQNSSLSLANWFGILFINVFGTWNGSFGINTAAGDPVPVLGGYTSNGNSNSGPPARVSAHVFRFVPHAADSSSSTRTNSVNTNGSINPADVATPADASVLAASISKTAAQQPPTSQGQSSHSIWRTAAIIGSLTIFYIAADAVYSYRRSHHS
ncbi:MAG: hypothetical protein ABI602_03510 [Candidatus Saccharibacteria bacterium]